MNVVFMGTPDFSVPALKILIENGHAVQAVLTQPDRPRGRGKKLQPTPVKASAEAAGIPVYTPQSLRKGEDAAEMLELLKKLNPELIVVIAYGQILPKSILDLPKYGCINLHASLLPRWRGAAPIQRAILAGDAETGVTAMQMAEGLDTGDMLHTLKTRIAETETAETLHDRLSLLSAETLAETLSLLEQGLLHPVPQGETGVTYAEKITKEMSRLDFSASAAETDRTIRAVTGYAMFGGKRIKLLGSAYTGHSIEAPVGTLVREGKHTLYLVCGDGKAVQLTAVQPEGSKPMKIQDFLNGVQLPEGACLTAAE